MNVYKEILRRNISRLLNTINLDSFSDAYGNADREFWGWKIKDFSNGTSQGCIHSLAIAYRLGIFSDKNHLLEIVDAVFGSIQKVATKKGSMAEAYPNEHSFCVTALVAFDALSAIDFLKDEIEEEKRSSYYHIIEPLIGFISRYDEKHSIISNHLATGVAAIALWNKLSGASNKRDGELLNTIYSHQSEEGWYREYEGADPGYQTLCTYYLTAAWEITEDKELEKSILTSLDYLKYFVHPDHNIGGLYGSRNTEVYYPAGIVKMASIDSTAAQIETALMEGIELNRQILPDGIDIGNFIPLLNAYARAAWYAESKTETKELEETPFPFRNRFEKEFPEAGIYLKATDKYYAITNYKKGGTMKVFDLAKAGLDYEYPGIFGVLNNNIKVSTQSHNDNATFRDQTLEASFYELNEDYPTPFRFLIIRILSLSIFRNVGWGITFKKMIVKRLMTGKNKVAAGARIKFNFTDSSIVIDEDIHAKGDLQLYHPSGSKAIHMASSGYNCATARTRIEDSIFVDIKTVKR